MLAAFFILLVASMSPVWAGEGVLYRYELAAAIQPQGTLPKIDSISQPDSISKSDSLKPGKSKSAITEIVDYMAVDSIYIDFTINKARLYNDAVVNYSNAKLTADYMEINFKKEEVLAQPVLDSLGKWVGIPHYEEGATFFDAKEILYSFATKRGLIKDVMSKESEIYIHGKTVKKLENDITYIKGATFTSCDLDHPHFDFRSFRAKVIPEDKMVVGMTMLHIMDIPTPIILPFGIFPQTKGHRSGILIPNIGQSARSGFFFRGLGYYWNINDYMDLKLDGDLYTGGNWEVRGKFRYAKRYRFQGGLNLGYSMNYTGPRGVPNRPKQTGIMVEWSHVQDGKAHPNSSFSANVSFKNAVYTQYAGNLNDYLNNTTASNITYSVRFADRYNLSINGASAYNTNTNLLDINLPNLNFSIDQFYLFKRKKPVGKTRWYETISLRYNLQAQNTISVIDTNLFSSDIFKNMNNGMRQQLSLNSTVKIFKHINWSNSINYNEYWYLKTHRKTLDDSLGVVTIPVNGFRATRDFNYNTNLNFRVYGIFRFKNPVIKAFRHVMTPSIGFSFRPDFSRPIWNNYDYFADTREMINKYSIYQHNIYGGPSSGMVGSVNFSLGNTFDLKVRNKKDSLNPEKNVALLDYFNISTAYNLAADSLRWAPITLSARTRLFNRLDIQVGAAFDFYKVDSNGNRYNEFFWENSKKKGLRFEKTDLMISLSWSLNPKATAATRLNEPTLDKVQAASNPFYDNLDVLKQAVAFNVPWNVSLNYTFNYLATPNKKTGLIQHQIIQSLGISGSISITPKWQITFGTGYDFVNKQITVSSINFSRDLHCWDMGFYWVPFGFRTEWNFTIRVKSSVFQDIKYEKRKPYTDNPGY
ncbi:MAG: putative LPS assembly protein LptD [Bacteroidales bacterium]